MSVPDAIRGADGPGNPVPPDAKAPEAIRTGSSRAGVTMAVPPYPPEERSARGAPPPAPMMKWIGAAVVLAVMVFGITFALNFVGSSVKPVDDVVDGPGTAEQLKLTFATTKQPVEVDGEPGKLPPPIDVEIRKEGWSDYWFENTNEKPVVVGLKTTSCSCSGAEVFLLALGSKIEPGKEATLEKTATSATLAMGSDKGVTVAPKQVGWVRLLWSGERRKDSFNVELWLNAIDVGPFPRLEVRVRFHEPVQVLGNMLDFDVIDATLLPRKVDVLCWSSTREDFTVSGEILSGRKGAPMRLVVGKPERLDDSECRDLAHEIAVKDNLPSYHISAAYRIPVTLQDRAADGTLIDAGPFRRKLELTLADYAGAPFALEVQGTIRGNVTVLGLVAGRIDFTTFSAKKGSAVRSLTLQCPSGATLEVDEKRTASFLDVHLKKASATPGETSWQLTVQTKEGAASGKFPRDEQPEYRDSAVYVRQANDPKARPTRIAVEGIAIAD